MRGRATTRKSTSEAAPAAKNNESRELNLKELVENIMATKKRVEVFGAGCPACQDTIDLVRRIAGSSHEVVIHDMHDPEGASLAKRYGIRSVPAVAVDGKLASCCAGRGPDERVLRSALT